MSIEQKVREFAEQYSAQVARAHASIDSKVLTRIVDLLAKVRAGGNHVYTAGNGGSCAISAHLVCDWTKGTHDHSAADAKALRTTSLTSNSSVLTALANDFSYEESLSKQLEYYLTPKDAVLLISSSGNSPNIVRAAEVTKRIGAPLIGLTGFSGGKLKQLADLSIHIPVDNYGIAEDTHQSVMHMIAQYLVLKS